MSSRPALKKITTTTIDYDLLNSTQMAVLGPILLSSRAGLVSKRSQENLNAKRYIAFLWFLEANLVGILILRN
jgi:hypothetical protein